MGYQQVGHFKPLGFREEVHQIFLDLLPVLLFSEAQSSGQSHNMGVYCHAFSYTEGIGQHHVGGLAGDSFEFSQVFH